MKLIKQTALVFRAGRTEKIYEIDLCEVGDGQFVVNFRYGRRGKPLKDGSKTVLPVDRAEAERVYEKLRTGKINAGYTEGGVSAEAAAPAPAQSPSASAPARPPAAAPSGPPPRTVAQAASTSDDPRVQAVLARLARGEVANTGRVRNTGVGRRVRQAMGRVLRNVTGSQRVWSLERAIWRAGELKIKEAEPYLLQLLDSKSGRKGYSTIWALGFCGSSASISKLNSIYTSSSRTVHERRIAAEALLKLYDANGRRAFREALIDQLPHALRGPARQGPASAFSAALGSHLSTRDPKGLMELLETVYLIDNKHVRPGLLETLRTAPLRPPWFRPLRHIFKAAEYRRDPEVFGLMAHRFERTRAMFRQSSWGGASVRDENGISRWYNRNQIKQELQSGRAKVAYSDKTRWYLRRRVWWTLRRLGERGDPDYVKMAVGVLLAFTDSDARSTRSSYTYSWRSGGGRTTYWDRYAGYLAFNHILYGKSPRYFLPRGSKAFRCKGGYKPGQAAPRAREESFPELWNSVPQGLMHLLDESRCEEVHKFAVKALRANGPLLSRLPVEAVAVLLRAPYEVTSTLGLELAERLFNPVAPQAALVLAAAQSPVAAIRSRACEWFDAGREALVRDGSLLGALLISPHEDVRWYIREVLEVVQISEEAARGLIGRLVAHLMGLEVGQEAVARDVADLLVRRFGALLSGLGLQVVGDLCHHSLGEVQAFAGDVLLVRQQAGLSVALEHVLGLMESPHAVARSRGLRLVEGWPDAVLLTQRALLMRMLFQAQADVRAAAAGPVGRLAALDAGFAQEAVDTLVDVLLANKIDDEVSVSVAEVLKGPLGPYLVGVERQKLWRLIRGRNKPGQDVGGVMLAQHVEPDEMEVDDLVSLADHEVFSVRHSARQLLERSKDRVADEMDEFVRVFNSNWDDTRQWACAWLGGNFDEEEIAPEILVAICDNIKEDVQRFGRQMITRRFRDEDGPLYMLRLSEHPSTDLQLFVTNYLDRYASGNPQRVEALVPYFRRVLCGIQKGRTSKQRIFAFLEREALASQDSAEAIAEMLLDVSATISIESRAQSVSVLARIGRRWPQVQVGLRAVSAPVRQRTTGTRRA